MTAFERRLKQAEEIAQSAILGAAAAGVLQVGLELPGAVSDVRSARAEVGSGADILSRVNQRLAQPGQVAYDAWQAGLLLPTGGSVETSGEQVSAPRALPTVEQNKTASTGETDVENETLMEKDSSVSQLQNEGTPSGRQEHGPSASGGGRNITVPFNGTPYRNDKSYRCVYAGESPISSEVGYGMFADDAPSTDMYGDDLYVVDHASLPSINDVKPAIAEAWDKAVEDWALPPSLDALSEYWSGAEIAEDFDPKNIIDGAGAWDNPDLVTWAFDNGVFDDIPGVKTSDGAIVWDAETVKRGDKNAEVWGQEDEPGQNIGGVFPKDSTGDAGTGLIPMTEENAAGLSSGRNNVIARKASDIISFVRNALRKKGGPERLYMGTIPDSAAAMIQEVTGMNVKGYSAILPGDSVQHIFNHHGNRRTEESRGQKAVTESDIVLIPQVLSSPDSVSLSGNRDALGRPVLLLSKQIGDTYVTAQAVTDGRHALTTNSLWIKKGKSPAPIPDAGVTTNPEGNARSALMSSSSIDPIIRQAADGVNSDSAQNGDEVTGGRQLEAPGGVDMTGPENAVGAARYGFDPYSHLLGRYGAIEPGETPARVVDVPRQTTERDRVSLTARTVMEAAATPEEFVPEIAEQLVNGSFSYLPISNQKRADRAAARIQRTGYADALANWSGQVRSGKTSADLVATGAQLYNAAVNAGDTARAMEILHDYIQAIRSGAQATQAARILKTLTPSGQLYMLQKEVNSLNDSLGDRTLKKLRRGGEEKGIVLDEALADAFLNAPDESAQEAAYDRLIQSVADQIPPTFADKWNAWRYMAMLANPRTHIRNIVGNVGFQPVRWTKDRLAAAIEAGVSAASGGQLQRTKSFVAAPELYRAAWNDWANVKDTLSGSKYDDLKSEINSRRRVFQAAPLEAVRKGNSNLLELEDAIFKRVTYTDALAGFLQANGVSAEQLRSGQADSAVLERARAYAGREALRATYQDRNAVSDAVVRGVRALGPFGEAVLPFKRTPANILVRGAEYSPLGLAKALTYDLRQVQQGKMTGADAIDNIAAGLTGTGLMALGAALFSLGLVTGGGGGDEKQAALDQLTGGQNYALNLPDGTSVTLDWLAPEALPFFMGVELMDALGENGASSDDIFNAISSVSEPMLQMSMLQSLNDLIDSVSYVDSAGKLQALAASAVVSYFSQAIPTIGGQIERTAEERRMSTYTDKSLPLPTDVQYALGRASARIPGWDYQQVPFIDAWGREEVSGPQPLRTFNNFLNPAYTSTRNVTAADEEVQRLYDATGDGGVIPERPRRYIIVDGVRKDLTGEEYVEYATLRGQTAYGLMEDLLDSRSYHSMSDEEKAGA